MLALVVALDRDGLRRELLVVERHVVTLVQLDAERVVLRHLFEELLVVLTFARVVLEVLEQSLVIDHPGGVSDLLECTPLARHQHDARGVLHLGRGRDVLELELDPACRERSFVARRQLVTVLVDGAPQHVVCLGDLHLHATHHAVVDRLDGIATLLVPCLELVQASLDEDSPACDSAQSVEHLGIDVGHVKHLLVYEKSFSNIIQV